jgi:integrase
MSTDPLAPPPPAPPVDLLIHAWLDEARGQSGSARTERAYRDGLGAFRAHLLAVGHDLFSPPDLVALAAQGHAGRGNPAPATFNQRLAILSSFYRYTLRQGAATVNPIDRVRRRTVQAFAASKALDRDEVRRRMQAIDRGTLAGQRDYCLLAVALQTGRRVAELAALRWGDLQIAGDGVTVIWRRTKGGKELRDALPTSLARTLAAYLRAAYGDQVRTLAADAAIWRAASGAALGTEAIRRICQKHLGTTRVHALRHTFAHTMEATGATLSEIQARLGHSNAATTGLYLAALKRAENPHADDLARLLGID